MNSVERVKAICKERKIPIYRLEKDLGYANGYIGQLRKGTFPDNRLLEIASYLHVPASELTGEQKENLTGEAGEAKKLLTREKYREFLKELSMEDLLALNADMADELRERVSE